VGSKEGAQCVEQGSYLSTFSGPEQRSFFLTCTPHTHIVTVKLGCPNITKMYTSTVTVLVYILVMTYLPTCR
jgi:hypothetical protein